MQQLFVKENTIFLKEGSKGKREIKDNIYKLTA